VDGIQMKDMIICSFFEVCRICYANESAWARSIATFIPFSLTAFGKGKTGLRGGEGLDLEEELIRP
jgi:hypothetical protein